RCRVGGHRRPPPAKRLPVRRDAHRRPVPQHAHPRRGPLPAGGWRVVSRDRLDRGDAGLPARVREGGDVPAQPAILSRHAAADVLSIPGRLLGDGQRHRRRPPVSVLRSEAMRALAVLLVAATASRALPALMPFGHACVPQGGVRFCPTTSLVERVPMRDGVPIDVDVTLPPTGDGPFPTIMMLHGLGGDKTAFEAPTAAGTDNITFHFNNVFLAQRGYAVVNPTARGWGNSCGAPASRTPNCVHGWIHLADQRWEVRDAQDLLGMLVD